MVDHEVEFHSSLFSRDVLSNFIRGIYSCFIIMKKVKVKVAQSCPTLCNPMDSTVQGILQARILE